jgi:dTMP kinase
VSTRGPFVVLEGGEGVGKTTQWERLREWAADVRATVLALREPGGTPPGDAIRSLLLDPVGALAPETEALLFAASRAELLTRAVRPALAQGTLVLLDRYLLSTYVYQGRGARPRCPVAARHQSVRHRRSGTRPHAAAVAAARRGAASGQGARRPGSTGAGDRRLPRARVTGFATALTPEWQGRTRSAGRSWPSMPPGPVRRSRRVASTSSRRAGRSISLARLVYLRRLPDVSASTPIR